MPVICKLSITDKESSDENTQNKAKAQKDEKALKLLGYHFVLRLVTFICSLYSICVTCSRKDSRHL